MVDESVRRTVAEAAWSAWRADLSVVPPMEDGSKAPAGRWSSYQTRRASEAEMGAWYGPHLGVGLVCGYGGLEVLELEGRAVEEGLADAYRAAADAAGLGALLDRVLQGYVERTPSGGFHLLYRVTTPLGNTKLARRPATEAELEAEPDDKVKVLAETRGLGGYIITAPSNGSIHPSGGAWTLEAGGFDTIATIGDEERDELWALARSFDRMPVSPRRQRVGQADGERASDRWSARHDITEIVLGLLEEHGWAFVRTRPDGVHELRRPGKDRGISATLGFGGPGVLHVFSTSTEFDEGSHSPFTVYVTLLHGRDWAAAGRALYEAEGPHVPRLAGDAPSRGSPDDAARLPAAFWEARPSLGHIRQAAWSRQRSPDAVLAGVLCRLAAWLPPELGLPPIVGADCGLSLLVAVVAWPGFGKSTAVQVARDLLPATDVVEIPSGSGEGLVEAMFEYVEVTGPKGKPRKEKVFSHPNLLTIVDEGQKATTQAARSGSTLFATWRSIFTGAMLGESNASAERNRRVPAGAYSIGVLAVFQPAVLEPLFADLDAGTPSRFLYLPATDPSMPDEPTAWPGSLDVEMPDVTKAQRVFVGARRHNLYVADPVRAVIRRDDMARQRGEVERDDWAAHRNLLRLKIAALLAILDSSLIVREGDWELAGVVVDTSDAVRREAQAVIAERYARSEEATTQRLARRASGIEDLTTERRVGDTAERVAAIVRRTPGIGRADARRRLRQSHRDVFDEALDHAISAGWIEVRTVGGQGDDKVGLYPAGRS